MGADQSKLSWFSELLEKYIENKYTAVIEVVEA